jgi:hypothetical protein
MFESADPPRLEHISVPGSDSGSPVTEPSLKKNSKRYVMDFTIRDFLLLDAVRANEESQSDERSP